MASKDGEPLKVSDNKAKKIQLRKINNDSRKSLGDAFMDSVNRATDNE